MRRFLFISMALVLAACVSIAQPTSTAIPTPTVVPTTEPQNVGSEIEQNKEKWQNAGISHYRYDLGIGCFCVFSQDMPLIIEVQDGKVVSMEYRSGKTIEDANRELFEKYATIDRLFAELAADLNGAADKVTVEYDPTYGFPTKADIDFIEQAVDDEQYLTISNFEKLP